MVFVSRLLLLFLLAPVCPPLSAANAAPPPNLKAVPEARSPHEALDYYFMDELQAVRSGPWKLKLETNVARDDHYTHVGAPDSTVPTALYNLEDAPR